MYITVPHNTKVLCASGNIICVLSDPNRLLVVNDTLTQWTTFYSHPIEIEACTFGHVYVAFVPSCTLAGVVICNIRIIYNNYRSDCTSHCTSTQSMIGNYPSNILVEPISSNIKWVCKAPSSIKALEEYNPQCFARMLQQIALLKWYLPLPQDMITLVALNMNELYHRDINLYRHVGTIM